MSLARTAGSPSRSARPNARSVSRRQVGRGSLLPHRAAIFRLTAACRWGAFSGASAERTIASYARIKRGRAGDLGATHYRSSWERNIARWLNWRKEKGEITAWAYEPQTFVFSGVSRGAVSYLPDFRLTYPDGSVEWLEVKGRETSVDRTKYKRMKQFYPHVKLTVLGADVYKSLSQQFGGLPHWEH